MPAPASGRAGAIVISVPGEGTGFGATSSAAPNAKPPTNSTVPRAVPVASPVSPRPDATRAAPSPSRSIPNSTAPSAKSGRPRDPATRPADRTPPSAPAATSTAPPSSRTVARITPGWWSVVAPPGEPEGGGADRRDPGGREEELAGQQGLATDHVRGPEGLEDGLREPQVLHRPGDPPVLDEPGAVPGHAGDHGFPRVHHVRVMEPCDVEA